MTHAFRENIKLYDSTSYVFAPKSNPCTFPSHWHTMAEFVLVTKDGCHYRVNEEDYILNAGECLLIWPTELHETVSIPEGADIILQFDSSIITNCKDFNVHYHNLRNIHMLKPFSEKTNQFFADTFRKIDALRSEPFAEAKTLILIFELLIELCQNLEERHTIRSEFAPPSDHTFYIIKKACSFIDSNCDRDLSQTEVAEYCGFSTYYFSKIFHKYTSETFPEYLTKRRLAVSAQLLQNKAISIADVSYQSGFQSISNFNKLFKKNMGCTPMQYRKLYSATT